MHVAFLIAQDSESSDPNLLVSLVPFLLIGLIMYFILIRPQRKRMREQAQLQSSVGVGDEVITTSGMFGFITGEDGPDRFWLEIDDDVQIRVARAAIQRKVDTAATDDKTAAAAKSDDASKSDDADQQ